MKTADAAVDLVICAEEPAALCIVREPQHTLSGIAFIIQLGVILILEHLPEGGSLCVQNADAAVSEAAPPVRIVALDRRIFDHHVFAEISVQIIARNDNAVSFDLRGFQLIDLRAAGVDMDLRGLIPAEHQLGKCAHIKPCIVHHLPAGLSVQTFPVILCILVFIIVRQTHAVTELMNPCAVVFDLVRGRCIAEDDIARLDTVIATASPISSGAGPPAVIGRRVRNRKQNRIHDAVAVDIVARKINFIIHVRHQLVEQSGRIRPVIAFIVDIDIIGGIIPCVIAVDVRIHRQRTVGGALIIADHALQRIGRIIRIAGAEGGLIDLLCRVALCKFAVRKFDNEHQQRIRSLTAQRGIELTDRRFDKILVRRFLIDDIRLIQAERCALDEREIQRIHAAVRIQIRIKRHAPLLAVRRVHHHQLQLHTVINQGLLQKDHIADVNIAVLREIAALTECCPDHLRTCRKRRQRGSRTDPRKQTAEQPFAFFYHKKTSRLYFSSECISILCPLYYIYIALSITHCTSCIINRAVI